LQYHRYSKFVNDLGISEEMIKKNLILTTNKGEKNETWLYNRKFYKP